MLQSTLNFFKDLSISFFTIIKYIISLFFIFYLLKNNLFYSSEDFNFICNIEETNEVENNFVDKLELQTKISETKSLMLLFSCFFICLIIKKISN